MNEFKGLHLLYKNLGETPNERVLRFKKDNLEYTDISMTYAGRLDPMAEGLLVVLSGDEIKNKDKFTSMQKTYEFDVLWGFETDTLDVLGLVESRNSHLDIECPNPRELENILSKSIGKLEQKYPVYSSKPVQGKPLFQWAREGRIGEVEAPNHTVEIFECDYVARKIISKKDLLDEILSKIGKVGGDFRQKEISEKWIEIIKEEVKEELVVDKIRITVSSGFYVRQFVSDLAKKLETVAVTSHITRTKIGEYTIADSLK